MSYAGRALVGMGSCGMAAGAERVDEAVRRGAVTLGLQLEVEAVGCLGECHREVVLALERPGFPRLYYGPVDPEAVRKLLEGYFLHRRPYLMGVFAREGEGLPQVPELAAVLAGQSRRLLVNAGRIVPASLEEYQAVGGYRALRAALRSESGELRREVAAAGVRGRSGSAFPTGTKWEAAMLTPGPRVVAVNADEGNPGTFGNRLLLEGDPHRVLEGAALAALAVEADEILIYVRHEYPLGRARVEEARAAAQGAGLLGPDVLGTGRRLAVRVTGGAGAFICGEETALLSSAEGRRGRPRLRPPYPAQRGYLGRPTVVHNVETVANLPELILRGAAWFRSVGTDQSPGTKIFSFAGRVARGGAVEVPLGTPLRRILALAGAGEARAVALGSPLGPVLAGAELDLPAAFEVRPELGTTVGSGGLLVAGEGDSVRELVLESLRMSRDESCGHCVPCREGLVRLVELVERRHGEARIRALADLVRAASMCGLGQGAPLPLLTAWERFPEEFAPLATRRREHA